MPNTTGFEFGEVVLVVSSGKYHAARRDVIVLAVTSQLRSVTNTLDVVISGWKAAGLLKPSVLKPVLATLEADLVVRRPGQLGSEDRDALRRLLTEIIGG